MSPADSREVLLAVDESNFEECEGLTLSPEEPLKLKRNPVIPRGGPGEPDSFRAHFGGSVVKHDGGYRMYYVAYDNYFELNDYFRKHGMFGGRPAVCESADGLEWHKPALRGKLYAGSRENNLLEGFSDSAECISVVRDSRNGRYVAVETDNIALKKPGARDAGNEEIRAQWNSVEGIAAISCISVSEDGISWEKVKEMPLAEKFETARIFCTEKEYVLNGQQMHPWTGGKSRGRTVTFFTSKDLLSWKKKRAVFRHEYYQTHVGIANLGRFGRTHLGLAGVFFSSCELPDQHHELRLVCSPDCVHWKSPFNESFIRRGDAGDWDGGGILQGDGYVEENGRYIVYYSGTEIGNTPYSRTAIGAVSFPRDRFGYYSNKVGWDIFSDKTRRGFLLTRMVKGCGGRSIRLNVSNTSPRKHLQVWLLDENGREIPGYAPEDSLPVYGDGVSVTAGWKKGPRLPDGDFKIGVLFNGGRYREECPRLHAICLE